MKAGVCNECPHKSALATGTPQIVKHLDDQDNVVPGLHPCHMNLKRDCSGHKHMERCGLIRTQGDLDLIVFRTKRELPVEPATEPGDMPDLRN